MISIIACALIGLFEVNQLYFLSLLASIGIFLFNTKNKYFTLTVLILYFFYSQSPDYFALILASIGFFFRINENKNRIKNSFSLNKVLIVYLVILSTFSISSLIITVSDLQSKPIFVNMGIHLLYKYWIMPIVIGCYFLACKTSINEFARCLSASSLLLACVSLLKVSLFYIPNPSDNYIYITNLPFLLLIYFWFNDKNPSFLAINIASSIVVIVFSIFPNSYISSSMVSLPLIFIGALSFKFLLQKLLSPNHGRINKSNILTLIVASILIVMSTSIFVFSSLGIQQHNINRFVRASIPAAALESESLIIRINSIKIISNSYLGAFMFGLGPSSYIEETRTLSLSSNVLDEGAFSLSELREKKYFYLHNIAMMFKSYGLAPIFIISFLYRKAKFNDILLTLVLMMWIPSAFYLFFSRSEQHPNGLAPNVKIPR